MRELIFPINTYRVAISEWNGGHYKTFNSLNELQAYFNSKEFEEYFLEDISISIETIDDCGLWRLDVKDFLSEEQYERYNMWGSYEIENEKYEILEESK